MNTELDIYRIDYKNRINGGYQYLPVVHSLDEIVDPKEVEAISFSLFHSKEDAEIFSKNHFSKSFSVRYLTGYEHDHNGEIDFNKQYWKLYFRFNQMWMNKTTGNSNEAAEKRLQKVIGKIKSIINNSPVS